MAKLEDINLNPEGFTAIRNGIREHVKQGKFQLNDLGLYLYLHLECDWRTGVYHGTAEGIAYGLGDLSLKREVQDSLSRLRREGYINYRKGNGQRGGYDILIHKFRPTVGKLFGFELNAWKNEDKCKPAYEPSGGSPGGGRTEDELRTNGGRTEDVRIPDIPEEKDVPEVTEVPSGDNRTGRFAETQGDPVNPKSRLAEFPEDDEELLVNPLPPVHSPQPKAGVIPPAAKIVRRDKGHRWTQTTNGLKCLACNTGWSQYERDRRSCPNEETDIEGLTPAQPKVAVPPPIVKEIPKPDPADYDMNDRFSRSEYKRALMDWQDSQGVTA